MKKTCEITARVLRILCVPPLMVTALILLLYFGRASVFSKPSEAVLSFMLLAFLPAFAYPCSYFVAAVRERGREGQRSLAMYFSALGYILAFGYGLLADCRAELRLLYATYLISVILLLLFNKVFHLRASGHACSVSGPIVFVCYFLGIGGLVGGVLAYAAVLWSSLYLRRHTLREFLFGTGICLLAFILSWLLFILPVI